MLPPRRKEIHTNWLLLYLIHFKYSSSVIHVHMYIHCRVKHVYSKIPTGKASEKGADIISLLARMSVCSFSAFYLYVNLILTCASFTRKEGGISLQFQGMTWTETH